MDSRAFMSVLPKRRCCLILSGPLGKSPGFFRPVEGLRGYQIDELPDMTMILRLPGTS